MHVVDSSSDDDSILEDDSLRSSSATPRPLLSVAGSHHSRGSAESRGSVVAAPRSSQSQHGSGGGRVSQSSVAARGAVLRDVDATPPTSRPSGA